ncbi:hypothetical protein [Pseudarthrobacter sulfonivorans]|uniref:hypothetical protein n=1 Tax=Pseudarthrobacter sulfonivorans TaxID=121292 RepID=UPI002104E92A|nr:hypothetical protein [Pseudarthrobacter sulfonivorans]
MARSEDYIEVDAVIRMPKGGRLADSKKTEGWSRGFTPNSTDKGPEHVEIRLKDGSESAANEPTPRDPHFTFSDEYIELPRQKTREQEELEEVLGLLVMLALAKATEWAQPRLQRLWHERMIPFFNKKRDQWQERKARRRADKHAGSDVLTTDAQTISVEETYAVGDALRTYEANITSAEARQHFAEALIAQEFVNMKMRLLANARVEDGGLTAELASAVQALTPKQVENALDLILASKPTMLDDLGKFVRVNREEGQLQLGSPTMTAALRLTNDGFIEKA